MDAVHMRTEETAVIPLKPSTAVSWLVYASATAGRKPGSC
jgi:hypothetical protein